MNIVLLTPLYPPDVAAPATYVKELSKRLVTGHHVVVVTYGRLPEQIKGVTIIVADKRRPLSLRLLAYTRALWRALRDADIVYAQNGPSVELPLVVVNFFLRRPLFVHWGDEPAHQYAQKHFLRGRIEKFAFARAKVIADTPPERPEILPFEPRPDAELQVWEATWQKHVEMLSNLFRHGI